MDVDAGVVVVEAKAVAALAERGVLNPERLLAHCSPEGVLRAVRWWDDQRNVRPGLLVSIVREGGIPELAPAAPSACGATPGLREVWDRAMSALAAPDASLSMQAARCWLDTLHPHALDGDGWTIGAESWVIDWIPKYVSLIRDAAGAPVTLVACEQQIPRRR